MTGASRRYAHCVLLFESIHDVTAAERRLRLAGLWCDMVPTPRPLSTNCGMVLEVHGRDLEQVKAVLGDARLACLGIYIGQGTEYVKEPWTREGTSR